MPSSSRRRAHTYVRSVSPRTTGTIGVSVPPVLCAPPPDRDGGPDRGPDTDDAEPVWSLTDWFGDDLTDPHLPPAAPPVVPVPDGPSLTGLTSLVAASASPR